MLHEYKAKTHGDVFNSIKFLTIPINPKAVRQFKHCIQVRDGIGVSTDGSRLHHAIDIDLPDGYYQPVKSTKTIVQLVPVDEIDFPDWSLLPLNPEGRETADINNAGIDHIVFTVARNTDENVVFNIKFLDALCNDDWTLHFDPDNGPLVAKNCSKTALIMPRHWI